MHVLTVCFFVQENCFDEEEVDNPFGPPLAPRPEPPVLPEGMPFRHNSHLTFAFRQKCQKPFLAIINRARPCKKKEALAALEGFIQMDSRAFTNSHLDIIGLWKHAMGQWRRTEAVMLRSGVPVGAKKHRLYEAVKAFPSLVDTVPSIVASWCATERAKGLAKTFLLDVFKQWDRATQGLPLLQKNGHMHASDKDAREALLAMAKTKQPAPVSKTDNLCVHVS